MRFLPRHRGARIAIKIALVLGYAAVMWFWIFPWLDRTFINRPAF